VSDLEVEYHETWLGMIQPAEGLVVSIPVLVRGQCMERQPLEAHRSFVARVVPTDGAVPSADIASILDVLGYPPEARQIGSASRYEFFVPEGGQTLRPTLVLRDPSGARDLVLVWELPANVALDRPESVTGSWSYPPSAKFDRLLRHAGIPVGLLSNGREVRLLYVPAGEATGSLTFRLVDMVETGGRPLFDAFMMLLSAQRLYGVDDERTLPRLLEESRLWQASVSERLAGQVFDAATLLLRGFEEAASRDDRALLAEAMAPGGDHVHRGILTALLRIVFLLYAEDSGLMPVEHAAYRDGLSVTGLYDELRTDAASYPDSMPRRFGGWSRLIAVFRAVFLGVVHGDLSLPPRRGTLFDPHRFPFLEGWGPAGSAPIASAEERAELRVPTVSDDIVLGVLQRLIMLEGQRISYRSLDVEQIGSVYESMLGFTVERLASDAVFVRGARRWITVDECLEVPRARRAKWFKDEVGGSGAATERAGKSIATAAKASEVLDVLTSFAAKAHDGTPLTHAAGRLVIQPRRTLDTTTTHYTPRSLCRPLVARVLEPVVAALGPEPTSGQVLALKVCDPAMGSGAFLVEACRHLGDELLAAWRREGVPDEVTASGQDPLIAARRVVAQRCLYGVDRNADAVELAKLSLWLVTLARELPFTFVDHALRHGDSLVGLEPGQIARFHWQARAEPTATSADSDAADGELHREVTLAMSEALPIRHRIEQLADAGTPDAQAEKQRLLWDADDAIGRIRVLGDLVLAAYFGSATKTDREAARISYRDAALRWLRDDEPLPADVQAALDRFRAELTPFHWMVELPEVFDPGRADPLQRAGVAQARMDAFAGNMPFIGGRRIATVHGERYAEWLCEAFEATGEVDYFAYFFLRANHLLGDNGTIGLIAKSSITEGDTRRVGLQRLIAAGLVVYDAQARLPWPGPANVLVAPVLLAKGKSREQAAPFRLEREPVTSINSHLRTFPERTDPSPLASNEGVALVGCFLRGEGFVLSPDEATSLLAEAPDEKRVIRPYLVGDDIAKDPRQRASRFVVDFALMDLEEARTFPRAMAILEERVRPDRERLRTTGADAAHRRYWWRFANPRVDLRAWLATHDECLVLPRVAKHLMIARVPTDQVFSEQVVVFTVASTTALACLQSRIHETWVRLLSSTHGQGLRYSATDCFDTFPFPESDPRATVRALETAGAVLLRERAAYLEAERIGLTALYNRLHDASVDDLAIVRLREHHQAIDRAVIDAYAAADPDGDWAGVEVPLLIAPAGLERFEDAIIERLFGLNDRRAAAEKSETSGALKMATAKRPPAKVDPKPTKPKRKVTAPDG